MPNSEKPDKEMLENLDLLINLDLIKSEKDWEMLKVLRKMKSMPEPTKAKESSDEN